MVEKWSKLSFFDNVFKLRRIPHDGQVRTHYSQEHAGCESRLGVSGLPAGHQKDTVPSQKELSALKVLKGKLKEFEKVETKHIFFFFS